eukprot:g17019.t1
MWAQAKAKEKPKDIEAAKYKYNAGQEMVRNLGSADPYVAHHRSDAPGSLRCDAADDISDLAQKMQQLYFTLVWEQFAGEGNTACRWLTVCIPSPSPNWYAVSEKHKHSNVLKQMDFRFDAAKLLKQCLDVALQKELLTKTVYIAEMFLDCAKCHSAVGQFSRLRLLLRVGQFVKGGAAVPAQALEWLQNKRAGRRSQSNSAEEDNAVQAALKANPDLKAALEEAAKSGNQARGWVQSAENTLLKVVNKCAANQWWTDKFDILYRPLTYFFTNALSEENAHAWWGDFLNLLTFHWEQLKVRCGSEAGSEVSPGEAAPVAAGTWKILQRGNLPEGFRLQELWLWLDVQKQLTALNMARLKAQQKFLGTHKDLALAHRISRDAANCVRNVDVATCVRLHNEHPEIDILRKT